MQVFTQLLQKIFVLNFSLPHIWRLRIQQERLNKEPNKLLMLSMPIIPLQTFKKFTCHLKEQENNFQENNSSLKTKEELKAKILLYLEPKPEQEWFCLTLSPSQLFKSTTEKVSSLNQPHFILIIYSEDISLSTIAALLISIQSALFLIKESKSF